MMETNRHICFKRKRRLLDAIHVVCKNFKVLKNVMVTQHGMEYVTEQVIPCNTAIIV